LQEQLDKEQTKREEAELTRMYGLLEMKLIKYRDISEDTCMIVDEKRTLFFSKGVRRVDTFWNDVETLLHRD